MYTTASVACSASNVTRTASDDSDGGLGTRSCLVGLGMGLLAMFHRDD